MEPLIDWAALEEEAKDTAVDHHIVKDPSVLRQKSEEFNFEDPQMDPVELGKKLVTAMVDSQGLGLSAIQLGIPLRVACIRARPQHVVLFNPRIVNLSDETELQPEGCLSFPGLTVKVKRPFEVRVRFKYPNGEIRTEKWGGLTSRVVQHEIDHMDGITFLDRANKFHRDQAVRKWEKWKRAVERVKNER